MTAKDAKSIRIGSCRSSAARIYAGRGRAWDGLFRLVVSPETELRETLSAEGFGMLPGGILVGVEGDPALLPRRHPVLLAQGRSEEDERHFAARAWPLESLAEGYGRFLDAFAPLELLDIPPAEALPLRLLLVHEWRRLVLRDPRLPDSLLPEAWPGVAAHVLVVTLYRRLTPAAESWLDAEGRNEEGALPAGHLGDRFTEG